MANVITTMAAFKKTDAFKNASETNQRSFQLIEDTVSDLESGTSPPAGQANGANLVKQAFNRYQYFYSCAAVVDGVSDNEGHAGHELHL